MKEQEKILKPSYLLIVVMMFKASIVMGILFLFFYLAMEIN